jgi:hypothetical protein
MIDTINIRHFRCFEALTVPDCRRLNVIVGDNATGKTSLLEAVFLTLAGNLEVSVRLRNQRGMDGVFNGTPKSIEEAIWRSYFHNLDWNRDISIGLTGHGKEARTLVVSRTASQLEIPIGVPGDSEPTAVTTAPLTFSWTDGEGQDHSLSPKFSERGLQLPSSREDLPDFFYFPAGPFIGSVENATRYSELRKTRRDRQFVELLSQEYNWIEDLSIEVSGGSPHIFASVRGLEPRIPLSDVSGGLNRSVSFLLAMASSPRSVILIDEIDSGLYHTHHVGLWRTILQFARSYESQLFVTTHNEEWLEALFDAAGSDVADIALWRFERRPGGGQPKLHQFSGKQVAAAVKTGEVR